MPSVAGYVDEEQEEKIDELLEDGKYEDLSSFINFCVSYTLKHKHQHE